MAESSIGAESFLPLSLPEAAYYPALLRLVLNGVSFRVRHLILCNLAVGLMVFKDTVKDNRPLVFWDAIGNLFGAWSALYLNYRRHNDP